ncbi:MAG: hypothetical protein H0T39_12380 [Actinobacteria bacterium]|nr:hypothetical protein [Actinomycetota bacterium]
MSDQDLAQIRVEAKDGQLRAGQFGAVDGVITGHGGTYEDERLYFLDLPDGGGAQIGIDEAGVTVHVELLSPMLADVVAKLRGVVEKPGFGDA